MIVLDDAGVQYEMRVDDYLRAMNALLDETRRQRLPRPIPTDWLRACPGHSLDSIFEITPENMARLVRAAESNPMFRHEGER